MVFLLSGLMETNEVDNLPIVSPTLYSNMVNTGLNHFWVKLSSDDDFIAAHRPGNTDNVTEKRFYKETVMAFRNKPSNVPKIEYISG